MAKANKEEFKRLQQDKFVLCYKVSKNDIADKVIVNYFKVIYQNSPGCESIDVFKSNLDTNHIHFDRFNDQNEYDYFYINCKWQKKLNIYYSIDSSNNKCLAKPKYLTLALKATSVLPILFSYSLTESSNNVQKFSFQDYINCRNISNKIDLLITFSNNYIEKESAKTRPNFENTYVLNQNAPLICFKVLKQIQSQINKINLILCFVMGSLSLIRFSIHIYFQIKTLFYFVKLKNFNSHCSLANYNSFLDRNKSSFLQKTMLSNQIQFPMKLENFITANMVAGIKPVKIDKTMLQIAKLNANFVFSPINEFVKTNSLMIDEPKVSVILPLTTNKINNLMLKGKNVNVSYLVFDKISSKVMYTLLDLNKPKPILDNAINCQEKKFEIAPVSDLKTSFKSETGAISNSSSISTCLTNPKKNFNFNVEPNSNPIFDFGQDFKQHSNSMCEFNSKTKTKSDTTYENSLKVDEFSTPKKKLNFDNVNGNLSSEFQIPVTQTQIQLAPSQEKNQNNVLNKRYYFSQRSPLAEINQNKMPPKHFN